MKHCPACRRTYTDEALKFCAKDGTPLVGDAPLQVGTSATLTLPPARAEDSAPTQILEDDGMQPHATAAGRDLGVRAVLTGRVLQRGDQLVVGAELTDVRDSRQVWGEQYNRKVSDLAALQQEISREITESSARRSRARSAGRSTAARPP